MIYQNRDSIQPNWWTWINNSGDRGLVLRSVCSATSPSWGSQPLSEHKQTGGQRHWVCPWIAPALVLRSLQNSYLSALLMPFTTLTAVPGTVSRAFAAALWWRGLVCAWQRKPGCASSGRRKAAESHCAPGESTGHRLRRFSAVVAWRQF